LQNGAKRYPIGRFALPRNVPFDPSGYFPDSLWKGSSRNFALTAFSEVGHDRHRERRDDGPLL
jgi:hypothetical protein